MVKEEDEPIGISLLTLNDNHIVITELVNNDTIVINQQEPTIHKRKASNSEENTYNTVDELPDEIVQDTNSLDSNLDKVKTRAAQTE
jgi:hypothetical protein